MLQNPQETIFLMEDEDGFLARVPESKVEQFGKREQLTRQDELMIADLARKLLESSR